MVTCGYGAWRVLKNVMGLWLVQQCRRVFVERGGTSVTANIRGGGEFGAAVGIGEELVKGLFEAGGVGHLHGGLGIGQCLRGGAFRVGAHTMDEIEHRVIRETVRFAKEDKALAAQLLGLSVRTIYRKLEPERRECEK